MELDSVHVGDIMEVKAVVPDSGVFRSLLTVSFQQRGKTDATVFMFQCEDVKVTDREPPHVLLGSELNERFFSRQAAQVEKDLARALATRRNHPAYRLLVPIQQSYVSSKLMF